MSTPTNVRMLGWIRSATHALMIEPQREHADPADEPGQRHRCEAPGALRSIMKGSEAAPKRAVYRMPIRDLKAQIARLPEQPGVYLYYNGQGETLYVGKARVLRDRVRSYLGAHGTSPRIDALLDEAAAARGHRHRLGRRGAGAREQPDQAAGAEVQHPAARRQDLSLPAADDRRGVPAGAGRAARRARRRTSTPARSCRRRWRAGRCR